MDIMIMYRPSCHSLLLAFFLLLSTYAVLADSVPPGQQSYLEENIPITMANVRGHKALYKEGWFVISSTEAALQYAHKHAIISSGEALSELQSHLKNRTSKFGDDITSDVQQGYQTGTQIWGQGTERSSKIFSGTHQLAQKQLDFSSRGFSTAWERFIQGNINLVERTAEDRGALVAIPGNYYAAIKDDFSNLYELSETITSMVSPKIENGWSAAFARAGEEFNKEYEESAEAGNSLSALFYIAWGYIKSAYYGLLEPGAK
ncbi:hypothetical protein KA005_50225, partial [bacterium]|nr:hypothetical protein [bacterium]